MDGVDQSLAAPTSIGTIAIPRASATLEDGSAADVTLRIPRSSRVAGGPIELRIVGADLDLTGMTIEWLITTRLGWAHFRGMGRLGDGALVPFRCDLQSSAATGGDGPDRIALRVYAVGTDPALEGPIAKLVATLPIGSVRLGP
jgi:hypothetical protein